LRRRETAQLQQDRHPVLGESIGPC
jgi:hypothetical protein